MQVDSRLLLFLFSSSLSHLGGFPILFSLLPLLLLFFPLSFGWIPSSILTYFLLCLSLSSLSFLFTLQVAATQPQPERTVYTLPVNQEVQLLCYRSARDQLESRPFCFLVATFVKASLVTVDLSTLMLAEPLPSPKPRHVQPLCLHLHPSMLKASPAYSSPKSNRTTLPFIALASAKPTHKSCVQICLRPSSPGPKLKPLNIHIHPTLHLFFLSISLLMQDN